jgi:hypothetical protein
MIVVPDRKATQPGKIDSLESIPGLLKSLKIRLAVGGGGVTLPAPTPFGQIFENDVNCFPPPRICVSCIQPIPWFRQACTLPYTDD